MASGIDVANIAKAEMQEIGGRILPNSAPKNKYCAWYPMDGYWCAMFVSYVCNKAGVPTSVVPKYSYCLDCIDWAGQRNRRYSKSQIINGVYKPQPGDIFLRDGHTGIIVSVSGSQFTTVEGNTGGQAPGKRTVGSHTWTFSEGNYEYIFNPDYPDKSSTGLNGMTVKPLKEETIDVPGGLGKYYTYMNWNTVTNMSTEQGRLIKAAGRNYDSEGYGIVGNRYALAMTSTFGKIGDYVDVYMSDGRIIHGILADEKSQKYTSWDRNPANKWGHDNGQCMVEFVVNWSSSHANPKSNGSVLKVINLGSYFDNPQYASGNIEGYMYSENSYSEENKEPTVVWNNRVAENIHPRMQDIAPIEPTSKLTMYANNTDITKYIGNLSWSNSIYELATTMSFDVAKSDAAFLKDIMYMPHVGDIIRMITNAEVFRGVVLKVDDGDKDCNKYSIADLGWYLNKTSQTYQFTHITAKQAIEEICNDLSIKIYTIPELDTDIKQIYFDKTISDILTDILSQCSGSYNYDFTPQGLRIYKIGDLIAYPEFSIATNVPQVYSPDFKGSVSHSTSIEDMKNSIKITSEKDNVYTELMVLQNRELIDKYGFLQKIVKIDAEAANASIIASEELLENGAEKETYSFDIIEKYDSYTRAGEVIELDENKYIIKSTSHSYKDGWHFNSMEVEKIR